MDIIGIDIKSASWTVLHVKRTSFGVKTVNRMVLSDASSTERLDALRQYLSSKGLTGARVAVSLPVGSYVSRVLEIPAPSPDAISGILRFELEKHLPYSVEEAKFSFEVLKKDGNIYTVYFAAARADYLGGLLDEFAARGIVPQCVTVAQAAFLNAAMYRKAPADSVNTAFVEGGGDGFTVNLLKGAVPVYSKSVRTTGGMGAEWFSTLASALKAAAGVGGPSAPVIKIGRCVVLSDQEADRASLAELSSLTGIEVESGDYLKGTGLVPADLSAFGAALSASGKGRYSIDLVPSKPDNTLRQTAALSAAIVIGLVLLVGSYIGRDVMAMSRFASAVSEIKAQGEKMRPLTESAIEMDSRVRILEEARGLRSFSVMDVLKEVSETIPSNTWLTGYEFKEESVLLEGFSSNASAALFKLERSAMFKDVEFVGQVVKRKGAEHFMLKLRTRKPGAVKQAQAEGK